MIGKTVTRLMGAAVGMVMMTGAAAAAQYEWTRLWSISFPI